MGGLSDFFRNGIMLFLGDTLGLFHAIFSIIGILLIFIAILSWGASALLGSYGKAPITMLLIGIVICSIFGFSYGITYFDIVV
ncbi:MAG: hypothetical protein JW776_09460 [Candidatus Lokiarchaeota archaeon]|nr:hypothetical protein [Candidatus Lokiarchaeota archaeon]